MSEARVGVLVVNLGSPDAPTVAAVRAYLRVFLSDPRVLDMNPIGRWFLLNFVILPTRPKASAHAYQQIWTEEGSPLLVHGRALVEGMRESLPAHFDVELAMRYGSPSITSGLDALLQRGADRLVIFPLYPHYASSSTGSTLEAVYTDLAARYATPSVSVVPPYYADPAFLEALEAVSVPTLEAEQPDYVLLSFHGLPERHVKLSDHSGEHCLQVEDCCSSITVANRDCYRAQCYATARLLAERLNLQEGAWGVSFQSRLGKTPWIQPHTDATLAALAAKGVKRLAVLCPAFTADCLETLEEIQIRNAAAFVEAGGERLSLVPCLNSHPKWIESAVKLTRAACGQ